MSSFPVLIAGHSQAKYFGKYLSLPDTDDLSFSGYRIDMMFKEIQPTVRSYQTIVLHVGANDLSRGTAVKTILQKLQQLTSDIWDINPTAPSYYQGYYHGPTTNFQEPCQDTTFCKTSTTEPTKSTTAWHHFKLRYQNYTTSATRPSSNMGRSNDIYSVETDFTSVSREQHK